MIAPLHRRRRARRQGQAWTGFQRLHEVPAQPLVVLRFPAIKQIVVRKRIGQARHRRTEVFTVQSSFYSYPAAPIAGEPIPHFLLTMTGTPPDRRRKRERQRGRPSPGVFFHTSVAGLVSYSPVNLRVRRDVTTHVRPIQGHSTLQYFITIQVPAAPLEPGMLLRVPPTIDRRTRGKRRNPPSRRLQDALKLSRAIATFLPPAVLQIHTGALVARRKGRKRHDVRPAVLNRALLAIGIIPVNFFLTVRRGPTLTKRNRKRHQRQAALLDLAFFHFKAAVIPPSVKNTYIPTFRPRRR